MVAKTDSRIAYGATCTWWDSIDKVSGAGPIPTCPHCRGPLYEKPTAADWWEGVNKHTVKVGNWYRRFVQWLRGRCFKTYDAALKQWRIETGGEKGPRAG